MASLFKTTPIKPPPAATMPDPEDMQARAARRKVMEDAQNRNGRDSTILGGGGFGNYSAKTLGSGSPS